MKYCKKCGTQMNDESDFCPKCGAKQRGVSESKNNVGKSVISGNNVSENKSNHKLVLGVAIVLLLSVFGGGYFYYAKTQVTDDSVVITQETVENSPKDTEQTKHNSSEYDSIQKEFNEKGIQGVVVASTKGHSNDGYLSLVKNDNTYVIVICDLKNNRIATTPCDKKILYYTDDKQQDILIFAMTIFNDVHDRDEKSGAWDGNKHILPVYAQYKFDHSGNVVPGMLSTGGGVKPSHYHSYFYEARNVDTINLFMTEMISLQKIVKEKGIDQNL